MKLIALKPRFIRRVIQPCAVGHPDCSVVSPHTEHEYHVPCALTAADGVRFLCPKCFAAQPDGVGVHWVVCWRPHVPADIQPKPGRWEFVGTSLDDLSLVAGSSSVRLVGGCNAHFLVEHGDIRMS
jgi:hypothetical protein